MSRTRTVGVSKFKKPKSCKLLLDGYTHKRRLTVARKIEVLCTSHHRVLNFVAVYILLSSVVVSFRAIEGSCWVYSILHVIKNLVYNPTGLSICKIGMTELARYYYL